MTPDLQLRVLGATPIVSAGSTSAPLLTQPRRLGLLAYLALARPRGMHARDSLIALLWPDHDEAKARHALRSALHAIRSALGDDAIVTAGDGLVGLNDARIECDAVLLEDDLAAGRIEQVLAAYHGPLLAGFHVSRAPEFERWLDAERRRIIERVVAAALSRVDECQQRGDLANALHTAQRAFEIDPDHEPCLRQLIALLDETGNRAGALRLYEEYAARLKLEYGAEPDTATTQLVHRNRAEAYVDYVRGTYLFLRAAHGGHAEDMHRSRALFEQAIARDPEFALAYTGLANYFAAGAARNLLRPFHEYFGRAIELCEFALARDSTLAIPHVHFGVQAMYLDSDWPRAGLEFARAAALDPGYAEGRRFLGVYLGLMGRHDEAVAELKEAARLEPQIAMFRNSLADAYMVAGRYEEALRELRFALELDPMYGAAHERLLRCHERLGRLGDAVTARLRNPRDATAPAFDRAFREEGDEGYRRERRCEVLAQLMVWEAQVTVGPPGNAADYFVPPELRIALAYAELKDWKAAAYWQDRACTAKPGRRPWFDSRPELHGPPH